MNKRISHKTTLKTALVTIGSLYLLHAASCAPVRFSGGDPTEQRVEVRCQNNSCVQSHTDQLVINKQPADILFVVDDSGSVADVQSNIAQRFSAFMQQVSNLDYRIGIITTDVSSNISDTPNNPPATVNRNGALQDGKLIAVDGVGNYFITPQLPNPAALFAQTIQLPESQTCASSGYTVCPSGDPRGIYAANLLVTNNYNSFLRDNAPLTIVIVSDSDERNSGTLANQGYPQGTNDLPATLLANLKSQFPNKPVQVDAIVVAPNDTACYNARYHRNGNPYLFAWYAPIYASLVAQTGGVLGSVCASDYTQQLGQIGAGVNQQSQILTLACRPIDDKYDVTFSPQPANTINPKADWSNNQISFDQAIPTGTTVTVTYNCKI